MHIDSISRPGKRPSNTPPTGSDFALFSLGFRPFYFLAASYAALGIPLWLLAHAGRLSMPMSIAPQWWHMHEMVYGFALAVVVGFLFTAARNWTGRPTPTDGRLLGLVILWVAARAALHAGLLLPGIVIELVFIGWAATAIGLVLIAAGMKRNLFVVAILAALAALDICFLLAARGLIDWAPDAPLRAALYLIVMLTAVFGGRVIPSFTVNAVFGTVQYRRVWLDAGAIIAALATFIADLGGAPDVAVSTLAWTAALLHAVRLAGWNPLVARGRPILWILHLSYAWMPIGFALLAASALGWVARPLAMHAFAVGLIGGLIIGMITRTALGHTGRPLHAGRAERSMYLLITLAALTRVLGPLLLPSAYTLWTSLSGLAWCAAFALYAIVYWPRLSRSRADGQAG